MAQKPGYLPVFARALGGAAVKLSTKGKYGVKALFELAMHEGAGPVSLKLIAERQGLSEHYLEQLVAPLRKAGLVNSVRGAQGGYVLGRPAAQVSVGDILRVLEGPFEGDEGSAGADDAAEGVWAKVRDRLVAVVDALTLGELVEEARKEQAQRVPMYHI